MPQLANNQQISAIHVLAKQAGFSEDLRRDFLERETGHRSVKLITAVQAGRVIEKLRAAAGEAPRAGGAVGGLTTPVARKLRALWISGWNLGLVNNRTDRAMLSFLERQCEVSHTRFLTEPGQASAAIEALKSWLAREAGVQWPKRDDDADASRQAVIEAQWEILAARDAKPDIALMPYLHGITGYFEWKHFASADYNAAQTALGHRVRATNLKARSGGAS